MIDLTPLQSYSCSRPFYELLAETVNHPDRIFDWVFCPYTIGGLGLSGVGLIVLATGFIGLKNWSESFVLPVAWLALVGPVLAAALLPGNVLRRIAAAATIGFVLLFIGLYWWWGRS